MVVLRYFLKNVFISFAMEQCLATSQTDARRWAQTWMLRWIRIGDSVVMILQANEQYPGLPEWLPLYVNEVEATFEQARAADVTVIEAR
jgi:hypothetical protein